MLKAAPQLAKLLAAVPRLSSERRFVVPPLALPDEPPPASSVDDDELLDEQAIPGIVSMATTEQTARARVMDHLLARWKGSARMLEV